MHHQFPEWEETIGRLGCFEFLHPQCLDAKGGVARLQYWVLCPTFSLFFNLKSPSVSLALLNFMLFLDLWIKGHHSSLCCWTFSKGFSPTCLQGTFTPYWTSRLWLLKLKSKNGNKVCFHFTRENVWPQWKLKIPAYTYPTFWSFMQCGWAWVLPDCGPSIRLVFCTSDVHQGVGPVSLLRYLNRGLLGWPPL